MPLFRRPHQLPSVPTGTLLSLLTVCALAFLVRATWSQSPAPTPENTPPAPTGEPLGKLWSHPSPGIVALACTGDGRRVLALNAEGLLRCFDEQGAPLWERKLEPGTDDLVSSADGRLTLAYSSRQPLARRVFFLDRNGHAVQTLEPSEAVETAVVSPEGDRAVLAAGDSLIFCIRGEAGFEQRVVRLKGRPRHVQLGQADSAYVALDEPPAVELIRSSGKPLWRLSEAPRVIRYGISASRDGSLVAVAGQTRDDHLELSVFTADGTRRWSALQPGRSARVRLSGSGNAVLLTYEYRLEHRDERRYERRVAYVDEAAGVRWNKGGAYTTPLCVSTDPQGEWVVGLEARRPGAARQPPPTFRLYGRAGERRWAYNCEAGVLIATASADGRTIATYQDNGVLEVLAVREE